jgi:hypothetical protein
MDHTAVSRFLLLYILAPIVVIWIYHLAQRTYLRVGEKKRTATLMFTLVLIGIWITAYIFRRFSIDDVFLIFVFALAAAAVYWQRRLLLPYRFHCYHCGKPLVLKRILFIDSNACESCDPRKGDQGGVIP